MEVESQYRQLVSVSEVLGFTVPKLTREEVKLQNAFSKLVLQGSTEVSGKIIKYRSSTSTVPNERYYRLVILSDKASTKISIHIPQKLIQSLYSREVNFHEDDENLIGLLAEHTISNLVNDEFFAKENAVEVTSEIFNSEYTPFGFLFFITIDGNREEFPIILDRHYSWWRQFFKLSSLGQAPIPHSCVEVQARISTRGLSIKKSEVEQLKINDILFFNGTTPFQSFYCLSICEQDIGTVSIGRSAVLTKVFDKIENVEAKNEGKTIMKNPNHDPHMHELLVDACVEIARFRMPISELKDLAPGSILEFGEIDTSEIAFVVENKMCAIVSIINIGDGVGFRIERLL